MEANDDEEKKRAKSELKARTDFRSMNQLSDLMCLRFRFVVCALSLNLTSRGGDEANGTAEREKERKLKS